jgi:hypothetical protein
MLIPIQETKLYSPNGAWSLQLLGLLPNRA